MSNFFTGYLAKGSGSASFVEINYPGYTRQPVTFGPMANGETGNVDAVTFTASAPWLPVTQDALFDASGNALLWWNTSVSVTLGAGQPLNISPGAIQLFFSALASAPSATLQITNGSVAAIKPGGLSVTALASIQVANSVLSLVPSSVSSLAASTRKRFKLFAPSVNCIQSHPATFSTSVKSTLITLPSDAEYARVLFRCNNVTAAMTLKGYIGPTSQVGNGWSAYDASGTAQTGTPLPWTPLNFASAGADVAPEDQSLTSAVTATVPNDDTNYWSDWVSLGNTLPRIDGGTNRLLLVRTQALTNPSGLQTLEASGITTDSANCGGVEAIFASNASISTLTAVDFVASNITHVFGVQYYSRKPGFTTMAFGSSITQGTTTVSDRSSWHRIAAKSILDATGVPISAVYNSGFTTPTTALMIGEDIRSIKLYKPDVVYLQVANRNDAITAAQQDITWRQVLSIAATAQANGAAVVLVTASPWSSSTAPTSAEDGYRQINNNRARAFSTANGFALLDYDAVVTDGGSPARLQSVYGGNADHPNDAAHAAVAAVLVPIIRAILSI